MCIIIHYDYASMATVGIFDDVGEHDGFDDVREFNDAEVHVTKKAVSIAAPRVKSMMIFNAAMFTAIVDDVFLSGSMPKLSAFLHSFEFYSADVDPENLAFLGHVEVYCKHIPFLCLYYANIILRGVGQVYICNNPVTGLLVCVGLYLSSPTLMLYGLLGAIFANLGAYLICPPSNDEIESGLFGYVIYFTLCILY